MNSDRPSPDSDPNDPAANDRTTLERAPIELPVSYPTLNAFLGDYLKNIRRGGTFIPTEKPLPVGTDFVFKLTVPALPNPLMLQGRVQWRVTAAEARAAVRPAGMGIGFVFGSEADRLRVDAIVERTARERLGAHLVDKLWSDPQAD